MSNQSPVSAASLLNFQTLDSIAKSCGLIARYSSKFSAQGFLLALLQSVSRGASSFNHIAIALGGFTARSMSRQAMAKRFSPASTRFLTEAVSTVISQQRSRTLRLIDGGLFRRVLVEDSTVISMAKSNAGTFPNNGNRHAATAGCKFNLLTDLISATAVDARYHPARDPDQKLSVDILDHCRRGDLILRDMGYFSLAAFAGIEARGAFWVSRLPAAVSLKSLKGLPLLTLLKKTRGNRLDLQVVLGSDQRKNKQLRCRLVATRLSVQQANKNRRARRREATKRGATASKQGLIRDGWSLLVTNLKKQELSAGALWNFYAQRWSIEIHFRAIKQASDIHKALHHKSSEHHLKAMVLATILFGLLSLKVHAHLRSASDQNPKHPFSFEKLCDAFAGYLLQCSHSNIHLPFTPDLRHIKHDKRTRLTLWQSFIHLLG